MRVRLFEALGVLVCGGALAACSQGSVSRGNTSGSGNSSTGASSATAASSASSAGSSGSVSSTGSDGASSGSATTGSGAGSMGSSTGGGATGSSWRGPQASIERVPGSNEVFLDVDGQRLRPIFVSVNPQGITDPSTGWQTLLDEIDLASSQGMPVIDLMLGNRTPAWLADFAQRLGNRQVYLWLRFDMWIPGFANLGVPLLEDLAGNAQVGYRASYAIGHDAVWTSIPFYTTLDQSWLDAENADLRVLLTDISQSAFGDRVIGVRTTYMAGGEWFQPPLAFHDGTLDESPPNAWPWSNPDVFSIGDYSASEQAAFAQWLADSGLPTNLSFPTPAERINPRLGHTFVVDGTGAGLNAALYHRFEAERVAHLQDALAATVKSFTGSRALVMVNNGYLFSLSHYNGSFHTALEKVLASPSIDAVSAPYNYNTLGSRLPGFPLIAHGPMDSPALHGKLWIHEDDSRPYWSTDGFRTTTTWAQDRALLLRNAATSLIHGNGLYYFDLPDKGWFGGTPAHVDETRSLYQAVQHLESKLSGQLASSGPVKPEIAVFIDDASYHLYPEFGMDGAATYGTANDLILHMVEKIAMTGAPVRYYLLDDLGNPDLDVSAFKAVFFLNTPRLTQAQRAQISARLMNDHRTLYFQFVSGLFDESLSPSWSLAAGFSPGVSSLADIEASSSTAVTSVDHGGYVIAYSPRGAGAAELSALVDAAGVHRYAQNAVVDGAGSVLMVHATQGPVTVSLPAPARVVDLLGDADDCESCSSVSLPFAGPDTVVLDLAPKRRLFRYEFTPGSVGGAITTDEQTYCALPDGAALLACGFTGTDYANAPITAYGQLALTYTGSCDCQPGVP